jgi:hypothetical protein
MKILKIKYTPGVLVTIIDAWIKIWAASDMYVIQGVEATLPGVNQSIILVALR